MPTDGERLQVAAAGLKSRVSGKMGNVWWAFMLRGLLALGLGVSALIWPKLTLGMFVRLTGCFPVWRLTTIIASPSRYYLVFT